MVPLMRSGPLALLLLALALLAPRPGSAQDPAPRPVLVDSAGPAAVSPISARGAFLRSLVLPGWGQAYVGSPGRGGLYFTLEAGSLWMAYRSWQQLREARTLDDFLRETGRLDVDEDASRLVLSREEQLEDWITLSVFFLLFSGADAYVAAQLADFDQHIGVQPTAAGVRLEATLPLGGPR